MVAEAATARMPSASVAATLRIEWHGRVPYRDGLALQKHRHRRVSKEHLPATLLLLEHDPVITLGRARGAEHVLADAQALAARGIEVVPTGRGGDVTYHGPGQLVAYPIVKLKEGEQDVGRYVHRLEEVVLRTAGQFGVDAQRVAGLRGLWVGNDKLAAIGVRMVDWVSCHGLAFNVNVDLAAFADIVPCGLHGRGVTSLAALLGSAAPSVREVADVLAVTAADVFGRRWQRPSSLDLPAMPDAHLGRDFFL